MLEVIMWAFQSAKIFRIALYRSLATLLLFLILNTAIVSASHAAHPLITEDTGTQGPKAHQIELNADWATDTGNRTKTGGLTYPQGVVDGLDLFLNIPTTWGAPVGEKTGLNDLSIGAKWVLVEDGGFSLGVKPELVMPTGDENKFLGNGRPSYAATVMAQLESGEFTWLFNIGASKNRFKLQADRDDKRTLIRRLSAAVLVQSSDRLTLALDVGQADAEDRVERSKPRYAVLGAIYSVNKNLDFDIGYKKGLNAAETDRQWGMGVTHRFSTVND